MKNNIFKINNVLIVGVLFLLITACDLGLQTEWEYEREPFGNQELGMTAYAWIEKINNDTTFNDEDGIPEFEFLIEALERTGLREFYEDPTGNRTFFLLRNNAFTGGGQLLAQTTGSADNPLDSLETDRLEHALLYHMLPESLSQDDVPKNDFHLYYQTLVPGDTGIMEINKRLFNQQIRINSSIARIGSPSTETTMPAGSKGAGVALHNFRFTNGIGHQLTAYVRFQPF